ncbi:MAG: DUF2723 domain-containing protein [Bacteroidales bacterium]|nr:DUF2723 domain-containing protein [Bacteroidales bacterium]
MKNFNVVNNLLGWIVFLIAAIVYILTLEPTVSLWDCGEFIACSYKLQVGHPPGAPLYLMVARIFSLFAGNHADKVAMMVNSFSAIASALTIMFLYWTITHLAARMIQSRNDTAAGPRSVSGKYSAFDLIIILGSGLVGSLAYTFSDTFWFSAVEGEVYASSSLFTAVVFWAILKWENMADEKYANRWLVLIAFLMGLSIGVHLLNLLAIPAIVMVVYYRKYPVSSRGIFIALTLSALILGTIMYAVIPGIIWLASRFELIFVNGFGMPFNSGILIYIILLAGALAYGIWKTYMRKKVLFNTILTCTAVIIIGYSSYAMIMIRSLADPPLDENDPETAFSLLSYINREQYGDRPLIKGSCFNARPVGIKQGRPFYSPVGDRYEITSYGQSYEYDDPEFQAFFPRMYSTQSEHIEVYLDWGGLKEGDMYEPRRDANGEIQRNDNGDILYDRSSPRNPPGFINNLRFFFTYQLGHMYFRYFFWNFAGRQNDIQADGGPLNGKWISGIDFVDQMRIGSQKNLPRNEKNAPSRNTYYFLPLILGIIGFMFQYQKNRHNFWIITLLFIFTGIAIVVYLNQTPLQPRERDYAYAGSFYAFSIWIGLGVLALIESLGRKFRNPVSALMISLLCLVFVPGLMASENWDDHDRSGRYTARDIAYNYLNTCAPNAILFTNGDNDTFPLWYAQEVEGIRTDVRVVNLMLLNMSWYADQMQMKAYESEPLPMSLKPEQYINGTRDQIYVQERTEQTADLKEILEFISSDHPDAKVRSASGETFNYIPVRNFRIPVDTAVILSNGTVKREDSGLIVPAIEWRFGRNMIGKSELIVLDILANNNWERPVYYASLNHEGTLGLEEYMQLEGFAYRLVPIKSTLTSRYEAGRFESELMYENLMEKFRWGNMNDPDVYLDDFHTRTMSIIRLRLRFTQLAEELVKEGETEKAISVLDRCLELTPNEKIPYDYTLIRMADLFFQCDRPERAGRLVSDLGTITDSKLNFYFDQNRSFISSINDEVVFNLQILQNLEMLCRNYSQDDLSSDMEKIYSKHYDTYIQKFGN